MSKEGKSSMEVYADLINSRLDRVENTMGKIFDRLDDNNKSLAQLTAVVDEYQRRSHSTDRFIELVKDSFLKIQTEVTALDKEMANVKENFTKDLKPIKDHVEKVSKTYNFFSGIPLAVKIIVSVFTLFTSGYGLFTIITSNLK